MSQPSTTTTTIHQQVPVFPTLPCRELALLNELKNPALDWQGTKFMDRKVWESGGPFDPQRRGSPLNPMDSFSEQRLCDPFSKPSLSDFSRNPSAHRHLDWHTIDRETLCVTTDSHRINFSRTRSDSYSHHTRQEKSSSSYFVTFMSNDEASRRTTLSGSEYPQLAEIFAEISGREKIGVSQR
jgi:hypothetical protein